MKIYYGWYIVAISAIMLALAIGGSIQAFGLYVLPVSEAYGLTRAEVNTGAILFNFGMAFAAPVLGRLIDSQSSRMVMAVSALLFGGSLVALGLSQSAWLSAAVVGVPLAAAATGCGTLTSPTLVARWFTAYRARAMAIAMMGISLGPVVLLPPLGVLIAAVGWRQSLVVMGIAIGAVMLLLALLTRDRPGPHDVEVRGSGPLAATETTAERPMAVGRILAMPQFWTISLSVAIAFGIMQAIIVSLVPFAQGAGLSITEGASLMSVYGLAAIGGTLLVAWLGDRLDRLWLLVVLFAAFAAASASLVLAGDYATILACTAAIGVIGGAITPAFLALLADEFGAASFGTVNGCASFISTIVGAGFIRFGGEVFDRTGSYDVMFVSFLAIGLAAALLMFATRPLGRPLVVAQP